MQYSGSQDPYAAFGNKGQYGSILSWKPNMGRKRMNVIPICLSVFVPWVTFCLFFAMMSFEMHYRQPDTCRTLTIIACVVFALGIIADAGYMWYKRRTGSAGMANGSWLLFLCVSCLMAVVAGMIYGNHNFWQHSEVYFDITALNSYNAVDPARMRGQELMDAGRVRFVAGTHLDLTRSMGFRNMGTYCVAPITGGAVEGNPPLANYDFWAVGKDCCTSNSFGGDFRCGAYNNPKAHAGLRLMRDEERAFYRLAVQQAESAFQVKATHPLFFHWVEDPVESTYQYQRDAFQTYFIGMVAYFVLQMLTVYMAATCFVKFAVV